MNIHERTALDKAAGIVRNRVGVPWTATGVTAISKALELANPEDSEHVDLIIETMDALDAFAELLRRKP